MMNLKLCIRWLIKALIAGIMALVVVSVAAYFYNYTGIHITNHTGATDYVWMKNQFMGNMKEGFSFIKMDTNGYNNISTSEDIDILLMGSSHMEAYQVGQHENCGYLLNKYLPQYFTYNIGISGHTIYRIADNIDSALAEYSPSKYVVIETNTVQLNLQQMNEVLSSSANAIKSYDSGILYYFQKIPAFKSLYNQLDNWMSSKSSGQKPIDDMQTQTVVSQQYKQVLYDFLLIIKSAADKRGIEPIIFYSPNEFVSYDGKLTFETDTEYYKAYKDTCDSLGIVFLDMSDDFYRMYTNERVLAHGFSNTAVSVGHLNKYGHKAIAETLADLIRGMEEK